MTRRPPPRVSVPPTRERRRARTAAARARILDEICEAATVALAEGGVAAVSMRGLGRRLGRTAMMMYNYYPSLEALLLEMRARALAELAASFHAVSASQGGARERLLALGQAYLDFAVAYPERYRLSHGLGFGGPRVEGLCGLTPSWELLRDTVAARLRETGGDADPEVLANMIWAALHGLVSLHLSRRLHADVDAGALVARMLSAIIDTGAGPPRDRPGAQP